MTDKKRRDRNKETKENVFRRIGNNLKRMFSALWDITKTFVRTVGTGLTATAIMVLAIPAFILMVPAALIILVGVIIFELFRPGGVQTKQPEAAEIPV